MKSHRTGSWPGRSFGYATLCARNTHGAPLHLRTRKVYRHDGRVSRCGSMTEAWEYEKSAQRAKNVPGTPDCKLNN